MTTEETREIQNRYYYLVSDGANPSAPIDPLSYIDSNGDSLLHIAAQRGDLKTVEVLVRAGKNVNKKGDMGCTALHYARMSGHTTIAEFLRLNGADESVRNDFGRLAGE